jgi:hypothetical protein
MSEITPARSTAANFDPKVGGRTAHSLVASYESGLQHIDWISWRCVFALH